MSACTTWLLPEGLHVDACFREAVLEELANQGFSDCVLDGDAIRQGTRLVRLVPKAQVGGPLHDDPRLASLRIIDAHVRGDDMFEDHVLESAALLGGGFVIHDVDECPYWHPRTGSTSDLDRILSIPGVLAARVHDRTVGSDASHVADGDEDPEIEIDWARLGAETRGRFTVITRLEGMPRKSQLLACAGPDWEMARAGRDSDRWSDFEIYESVEICAKVAFDRGAPKNPSYVRVTFEVEDVLVERDANSIDRLCDFARGYVERLRALGFRSIDVESRS